MKNILWYLIAGTKGGETRGKIIELLNANPCNANKIAEMLKKDFKGRKVLFIFQPHLYTRTRVLFKDFVAAFKKSGFDKTIFWPIYAAREAPDPDVSSEKLSRQVPGSLYIESDGRMLEFINSEGANFDVCVIAGAGDVNKLTSLILNSKH